MIVSLLDLVGIGLLVVAGFVFSPIVGLALAGVGCLAVAYALEPKGARR